MYSSLSLYFIVIHNILLAILLFIVLIRYFFVVPLGYIDPFRKINNNKKKCLTRIFDILGYFLRDFLVRITDILSFSKKN